MVSRLNVRRSILTLLKRITNYFELKVNRRPIMALYPHDALTSKWISGGRDRTVAQLPVR